MSQELPPFKKLVGGIKLPNGAAIGPMFFSMDGKRGDALVMSPPIGVFDFGVTNAVNQLKDSAIPLDEFQVEFYSLLENLVADTLVYFQNRLQLVAAKSKVGQFNSIDRCIDEYEKYSIDVPTMCDLGFLKDLDRARGDKHHTSRRYDANYTVGSQTYDTVPKLRELAEKVRAEIHTFDKNLSQSHKDYEVKVSQEPGRTTIEFTAIGHAFDMTKGGRVVPKKPAMESEP